MPTPEWIAQRRNKRSIPWVPTAEEVQEEEALEDIRANKKARHEITQELQASPSEDDEAADAEHDTQI